MSRSTSCAEREADRELTAMILYHCIGARSFRPLWTMEELELDYELRILPFPPRQRQPEYLSLNPLGTVPLFIDGALSMTESVAICQYLFAPWSHAARDRA